MDIEQTRHVLDSLMILSFLVFTGLVGIIVIRGFPLTNKAIALPFAFLFISMSTLAVTGQIDDNPKAAGSYLMKWLFLCFTGVIISAITFAVA